MTQLQLCIPKSSIKVVATVPIEMLCSCTGGCLSNVSLVSKKILKIQIMQWQDRALNMCSSVWVSTPGWDSFSSAVWF